MNNKMIARQTRADREWQAGMILILGVPFSLLVCAAVSKGYGDGLACVVGLVHLVALCTVSRLWVRALEFDDKMNVEELRKDIEEHKKLQAMIAMFPATVDAVYALGDKHERKLSD